ncbi:uncharacterized protein [Epargyreus clarus]|uniref:uncharacterized protein n=1 Tax=Epargyreus clarus TaxID=520877 RepID=UPI003C3038E9
MSEKHDGHMRSQRVPVLEGFSQSPNSDSQECSSVETSPFRGFERVPRVLIQRLMIESFNNNDKPHKLDGNDTHKAMEGCYRHPQLLYDCSVKLVRDNLEQLKKDVLMNSCDNKTNNGSLNMSMLRCKICEKAYSSEKKLQNHLENKHMLVYKPNLKPQKRVSFSDHVIVHEVMEYHRCRKCTKIYEDYQSLKLHMKERHKKRKCYICHYCSKKFVDRMFFKVHIKLHCDVCGLLLPNKSRYNEHRRQVCRVLKKYKCKTCYDSFFKYMDLKDHSYDHLENLFICDICKDQFDSKCAVSHHISFLHSEKRPRAAYTKRNIGNDKLYLCNFCELTSVDREIMEKHVAVLPDLKDRERTGYKDFYFCDQCLKKFDTETNMLQHKWTHFLRTCDDSQVQQNSLLTKPQFEFKRTYKLNEKLPELMQPRIVLERIDKKRAIEFVDSNNFTDSAFVANNLVDNNSVDSNCSGDFSSLQLGRKKAIVDPVSKKTLLSRYQCEKCSKYYSSNYCLNRHIVTMHSDYSKLRCNVCEETFVWPSLLQSHRCIRLNIPEMPFNDAREEILFENFGQSGFDELMNISDSEDYMHSVDFEIPAPIVELTEYENCIVTNGGVYDNNYSSQVHNGYKVVMQEVPIEF